MHLFLLLLQAGFYFGLPAWALSLLFLPPGMQAAFLAWGLVSAGLWMLATFFPESCGFVRVARSFRTEQPEVWLTFDDGPDPARTPATLALLARHRARATFFVVGKKARSHPELVARIAAAGHEVANHSDSHPAATFWFWPAVWIRREIDRCAQSLGALASGGGYFRPPAGLAPPTLARAVAGSSACRVVLWSARAFDTRPGLSPEKILAALKPDLRPGAIVLLHPERSDRGIEALELLLDELARHGLRPVSPPAAGLVVR